MSPPATSQLGLQACQWESGTWVTIRLASGTLHVKSAGQALRLGAALVFARMCASSVYCTAYHNFRLLSDIRFIAF